MAKILVIDDDKTIQTVFKQFLERQEHKVVLADDGRQGMRMIEEEDPQLIITDIMMPEMDGLEILMEIGKLEKQVPIIAISGGMRHLPVNFLKQAKMFGARYVFEKPVALDQLEKAVQTLLDPE